MNHLLMKVRSSAAAKLSSPSLVACSALLYGWHLVGGHRASRTFPCTSVSGPSNAVAELNLLNCSKEPAATTETAAAQIHKQVFHR
jgi:hypothetical protein